MSDLALLVATANSLTWPGAFAVGICALAAAAVAIVLILVIAR